MRTYRLLKILEVVDPCALRNTGIYHSLPLIRLQGKWLRLAGFTEGHRVTVRVEPGKLTVVLGDGASNPEGAATDESGIREHQ